MSGLLRRLTPHWIKAGIRAAISDAVRGAMSGADAPRGRTSQYVGNGTILTETFFGRMIFVDGEDNSLSPHLIHGGRWEQYLTDVIMREVAVGHTFIDIGANLGFFTLLAAHIVGPTGRVVAAEPQPRLTYLLGRSLDINGFNGFATLLPIAIGKEPGEVSLIVPAGHLGGASIRQPKASEESLQVRCEALPTAVANANIQIGDGPLFIKMDIEGYEYSAWLGMKEWLRGRRVSLAIEFSPRAYARDGHDAAGFVSEMLDEGFSVTAIDHVRNAEIPFGPADAAALLKRGGHVDLLLRQLPR